ncbi:HlyD family type I secretion periplasmic adaptor subunit [Aidingimonas halophila]|uniref:Membrane fusion protein (MFP) family protein n=1 Tax=Aidingimonas halophila TaxID=574349 RepID=A0A1H3HB99_9GAMM|nr:HlyD family type I secretion periplasmic adaptor subunit [Aidingimonas halophila]GHC36330.1 HlyD family type I secretion periplasmic adaptor subunit [Aidingimonas halophila]SDY12751.1 membrane fusion protein, adhesin transport system [Aidingimonas halophila]
MNQHTKIQGKTAEQQGFDAIGRVSERGGKPFRPLIDRLFARRVSSAHIDRDWASDADWARIQQNPLRAKLLLYVVVLAVVGLGVWAYFAEIDEVTKGTGRVIPASQTKVIQSYDGGVVQDIQVEEGQVVGPGQLLMSIDPTRYASSFREGVARSLALQAKSERLRALTSDQPYVPSRDVLDESPELAAHERELYESSKEELEEEQAIAREQLTQRREELREAQARYDSASRTLSMASEELRLTRPLLESGAVSEVDILRLEREVSQARGEQSQAEAQVARLESAVEEAQGKVREVKLQMQNEWRAELSETLGELSAIEESNIGLKDKVTMAEIRSPVQGTVKRLHVNTLGGVVQQGQEVVEIVPSDDQLLIEARIAPQDIAFLSPGQKATVKFTAYDYTTYGGMEGELEHISADTITDDDDNTFYLVRVRTDKPALGEDLTIIPGMTAEVDIMTGKRTVMEYLLKPILRAKNNALTER